MPVKLFALSTCPYCRMTREFLTESGVDFELTEVDLLDGDTGDESSPKGAAVAEVQRLSGGTSFPVVQWDDEVIAGFNKVRLQELAGK